MRVERRGSLAQGVGLDAGTWLPLTILVAVSQILCVLICKVGMLLLHTREGCHETQVRVVRKALCQLPFTSYL